MTESIDVTQAVEQIPDTPCPEEEALEKSDGSDSITPEEAQENDTPPPTPEETLDALRQEVEQLRAALAAKEQEQQKTLKEIGEFHQLFPDVPIQNVPDGVWDSVEQGIPLSAAFALYEKKQRMSENRAEEINRRNAARSAGKAGKHTAGEYFSPDEVRAMSQRQVHQNYRAIMESMKHWH